MKIFLIVVTCIFVFLLVLSNLKLQQKLQDKIVLDKEIVSQRERLQQEVKDLTNTKARNAREIENQNEQMQKLHEQLSSALQQQEIALQSIEEQERSKAFDIKNKYATDIDIYKNDAKVMEQDITETLQDNISETKEQFNKINDIVMAATESLRRQQAADEQKSFYMLHINETDKADFVKLSGWKEQLNAPRILSMLLWQTYIQKPLKTLSSKVLGDKVIIGIYKITYVPTGECYIGQAVDVNKRWQEHCKCGCGIDTPASNKLYQAMQKYGIWNFSFELLESCKKEELNEKEATYIKLFNSVNNGYNTSSGIGKPVGM